VRELPPEKTSIYAAEGAAAHYMAGLILKNKFDFKNFQEATIRARGYKFEVTDEMISAVRSYVRAVRKKMKESSGRLLVERRIDLGFLHPQMFGFADAVVIGENGHISVFDFKYGRSAVPAGGRREGGWTQMAFYALGAAHIIGFARVKEVEVVIIQPRRRRKRVKKFTKYDLENWASIFSDAAKESEKENARLKEGDHCDYCPARRICPLHVPCPVLDSEKFKEDWQNSGEGRQKTFLIANKFAAEIGGRSMKIIYYKTVLSFYRFHSLALVRMQESKNNVVIQIRSFVENKDMMKKLQTAFPRAKYRIPKKNKDRGHWYVFQISKAEEIERHGALMREMLEHAERPLSPPQDAPKWADLK
jgi:hypothetical protein